MKKRHLEREQPEELGTNTITMGFLTTYWDDPSSELGAKWRFIGFPYQTTSCWLLASCDGAHTQHIVRYTQQFVVWIDTREF